MFDTWQTLPQLWKDGNTKKKGFLMSSLIDLTDKTFGRLTVKERAGNSYVKHNGKIAAALWKVQCECGEIRYKTSSDLIAGRAKSCGCYARQLRSQRLKLPDGEASRNKVLASYKSAARKRNYSWNVSEELFDTLINGDCYYCGSEPRQIQR